MKLYALYFSPTGGTRKVLDIICSAWNCQKEYINLSDISKLNLSITFNEKDICIVSVPSFSGRVPQFIIPILQQLQGNNAKVILITTYGNRAFDDTLLELKDTMEQSSFLCYCAIAAAARHSVMPKYGSGRPDSDDIEELKQFSIQCCNILKEPFSPLEIPGNRPYRRYVSIPITPKADKHCIDCGLCNRTCPVHAIPDNNYRKCNANICISCLQYIFPHLVTFGAISSVKIVDQDAESRTNQFNGAMDELRRRKSGGIELTGLFRHDFAVAGCGVGIAGADADQKLDIGYELRNVMPQILVGNHAFYPVGALTQLTTESLHFLFAASGKPVG